MSVHLDGEPAFERAVADLKELVINAQNGSLGLDDAGAEMALERVVRRVAESLVLAAASVTLGELQSGVREAADGVQQEVLSL